MYVVGPVQARRSRDCLFFYSSKQPMPRVFLISSNVPGTPVLELRMVLVKLCVSVFFQGEECGSSLAKPATMSTEVNARGSCSVRDKAVGLNVPSNCHG